MLQIKRMFLFIVLQFILTVSATASDSLDCKPYPGTRPYEGKCLTDARIAELEKTEGGKPCTDAKTKSDEAAKAFNRACNDSQLTAGSTCIQKLDNCLACVGDKPECKDKEGYEKFEEWVDSKYDENNENDPTEGMDVDAKQWAYCPQYRSRNAEALEDKRKERKKDKEGYEDDLVKQKEELDKALADLQEIEATFQEELEAAENKRTEDLETLQEQNKLELGAKKEQYDKLGDNISALVAKVSETNLKLEADIKATENQCYDDAMNQLYRRLEQRRQQITTSSLPSGGGFGKTLSGAGQSTKTMNKNFAATKYSDCVSGKKYKDTIMLLRKAHMTALSAIQSEIDSNRKRQADIILETTGKEAQEKLQKKLTRIDREADTSRKAAMRKYQNAKKRAEASRDRAMAELKKIELRLKQATTELEQIETIYSIEPAPKGKNNPDIDLAGTRDTYKSALDFAQQKCCGNPSSNAECTAITNELKSFGVTSATTTPSAGPTQQQQTPTGSTQ